MHEQLEGLTLGTPQTHICSKLRNTPTAQKEFKDGGFTNFHLCSEGFGASAQPRADSRIPPWHQICWCWHRQPYSQQMHTEPSPLLRSVCCLPSPSILLVWHRLKLAAAKREPFFLMRLVHQERERASPSPSQLSRTGVSWQGSSRNDQGTSTSQVLFTPGSSSCCALGEGSVSPTCEFP